MVESCSPDKPTSDLLIKTISEGKSVELYDKHEFSDEFKQKICFLFF